MVAARVAADRGRHPSRLGASAELLIRMTVQSVELVKDPN
jgi:hypothetical protein